MARIEQKHDINIAAGLGNQESVPATYIASTIYTVRALDGTGSMAVGYLSTDGNGMPAGLEITAGGVAGYELLIDSGELAAKSVDDQAHQISVCLYHDDDSTVSTGINNADLPMRINEPLFAAAFASAIRTQPGVAISLLPYLINPIGTGMLVASNFQGILATQVIIDQSSRSITVNKSPDEGEYTFDLTVAQ